MNNRIFLIRHGETHWNREGKLQGHSDIPLNEVGKKQAQRLRDLASSLPIHQVVSSDLKRARETASLAFPSQASQLYVDPRLREIHLGEAEGSERERLEKKFGQKVISAWFETDFKSMNARFPGGESRQEAIIRLRAAVIDWTSRFPRENLAFVTHGLLMRSFAQEIAGQYRPEFRAPNCAVFELVVQDLKIKMAQIYWAIEDKT